MSPRIACGLAAAVMLALLPAADARAAPDPVARGLAARAQTQAGDRAFYDRLRRAAQRPSLEEATPQTGVTLSVNAGADAALSRVYAAAASLPLLATAGGRPTAGGTGSAYLYFPVASVAPATNGNVGTVVGNPSASAWGWAVEFATDSDKVEVRLNTCASCRFRIAVDGHYVGAAPVAGIDFVAYAELDFAGVRRPRLIRVEASDTNALRGIAVPPTSSIWKPAAAPDRVTALATGDSYSEGQGASSPGVLGWPQALGRLMGWTDVRQVAVGGTGYLNTGGGLGRSRLRDQIARWLAINDDLRAADIDVVTVAAGYNDATMLIAGTATVAQLQAEALADFRLIRRTCPNALVIVFGASAGARGPDAQTLAAETAIKAAFTAWRDPRALFVPVSGDASPWLFGTGRTGAPNGSGNSDVLVAADGIHPSDAGHALYARRAAAAIRAALSAR